jgi:hypothetical protein
MSAGLIAAMSAGLKGDIGKLRAFERSIRELPRMLGAEVATASASKITALARGTFNAGETAYGDTWAPGAEGQKVTLRKSGGLAGDVEYVAIGTRLRARLGRSYAKYQMGKRPIFPRGKLPVSYVAALRETANAIIQAKLKGGG